MKHKEGDFAAKHIYSLAAHWVITDALHLQSQYSIEGISEGLREEVEYHVLLNYIQSDTLEFEFCVKGKIEEGVHEVEVGPGIKSEFAVDDGSEIQMDIGAFVGLTNETENYGIRSQCSFQF